MGWRFGIGHKASALNRHRNAVNKIAENVFGLFRAFDGQGSAIAEYDAMSKGGNGQPLEIVRFAEGAALEVGHGLRGVEQHE